MGGAARNARKRKQNQARGSGAAPSGAATTSPGKATASRSTSGKTGKGSSSKAGRSSVAAARAAGPDRTRLILGVIAVVVIAAVVIGGVIWTNNEKNATQDSSIPVSAVNQDFPSSRDGASVLVGPDTARVTLDVYEDFLCPACGAFEDRYAEAMEKKMAEGTLRVRYHLVNLLNELSDPVGYSTDSANAALLAADEGKFLQFHKSLFDNQPAEGGRGWSKDQLIELGTAMGITSQAFADGVRAGTYDSLVTEAYEKARGTESLLQEGGSGQKGFGTPTLAVDNRVVDTSSPTWLDDLVAAGS
ncbi:DsbA family protein [Actinokineospora pegani]|uniref:DsbA family protein n=1 Tax=Actinokineospora pegani TaxID=2654637 RepID=UPI0012E9D002|nr:thioredoxin domain-containing protein [Actinokineospora pegani]